jgi:hypothetical protein
MTTFEELCEKLSTEEECFLLELLEISSEEIIELFKDRVEERREEILLKLDLSEEDERED